MVEVRDCEIDQERVGIGGGKEDVPFGEVVVVDVVGVEELVSRVKLVSTEGGAKICQQA